MKKRLILRVCIPVLLILWAPIITQATIYNDNGSSISYNLINGDVLNINAGTYQGNIEKFEKGALIKVMSGATFKPQKLYLPQGKVVNFGIIIFNFPGASDKFEPNNGFELDNYGIIQVIDQTFTHSSETWLNRFGAMIHFKAKTELNPGLHLTNNGTIISEEDFILQSGTTFLNNNMLDVMSDVSFNGGISDNKGAIQAKGSIYYNIAATHSNSCRLITDGDFQVSYGLINDGFILLKGNGSKKTFRNFGTSSLMQMSNSIVKAPEFINYGTIGGTGSFYFTENSYNFGTVGSSTETGIIKVFEATRVNPTGTFDYNWGSGVIHSNVSYSTLPEPAEDFKPSGCSPLFGAVVLPLKWVYLEANTIHNIPVISWKASFDNVEQFIIERSTNNRSFHTVSTIMATTDKFYSFTDNEAVNGPAIYYRIKAVKANGQVEYSETKKVLITEKNIDFIQIRPNPTLGKANFSLKLEKEKTIQLNILSSNGLLLTTVNYLLSAGVSKIEIPHTIQLKPGTYIIEVRSADGLIGTGKLIKQQ